MASYTITLKEIVDMYALDGASNIRDKIELARPKIFDFEYPFYDESKRKEFEIDFIRNFFMREIGFETEELWKFNLENYLRINMGYWNNMFKSELLEFDPLTNAKYDETNNRTKDQNSSSTGNTSGSSNGSSTQNTSGTLNENDFNRKLESNTPDTRLAITANNGQGVIEYASNIEEINDTASKNSSSTGSSTSSDSSNVNSTGTMTNHEAESDAIHKEGKTGDKSFSVMLQEYRETFLRIEKQIFNEMNQLFMLVY